MRIKRRTDGYQNRRRHWVCKNCLSHYTVRHKLCLECGSKSMWLFDSDIEYERYKELRWLSYADKITGFEPKKTFVLVPFDCIGREIPYLNAKCQIKRDMPTYVCDFFYVQDGNAVVEDVKPKSKGAIDPVFRIKAKIFAQLYGFEITIVGR